MKPMKQRLLNLSAILTSLIVYLEWGGGNSTFLFQAEWDVIQKMLTDPRSVAHPFTVLPLFAQIVLIITLFQKQPSRLLTNIGIVGIGLLVEFIFFIGLIGSNPKVALSTVPFSVAAVLVFRNLRTKVE